jgi:uncharacterized membrane protein
MITAQLLDRALRLAAQAKTATTEDIRAALERVAKRYAAFAAEQRDGEGRGDD